MLLSFSAHGRSYKLGAHANILGMTKHVGHHPKIITLELEVFQNDSVIFQKTWFHRKNKHIISWLIAKTISYGGSQAVRLVLRLLKYILTVTKSWFRFNFNDTEILVKKGNWKALKAKIKLKCYQRYCISHFLWGILSCVQIRDLYDTFVLLLCNSWRNRNVKVFDILEFFTFPLVTFCNKGEIGTQGRRI